MKNIAVFCSASDLEDRYTKPAAEFATRMAKAGYHLVWGGSEKGLMKIIADAVEVGGGNLIGVSVEHLKSVVRKNTYEMTIAKTLGERKALMLEKCDAVVALVGGIGTLDEIMEIVELKKHGLHNKPVILLNTENFYAGLKTQLTKMYEEGFISKPLAELITFAETPEEALSAINAPEVG